MKWLGRLCWHVGKWLNYIDNWWYDLTYHLSGWQEAEEERSAYLSYLAENRIRCFDLDDLLERTESE